MPEFWTQVTNSKIFLDYGVILRWHLAFEDYDVIFYEKSRFLGSGLW